MYFLDTYAMVEFTKGNLKVKNLLENNKFFTSDFQLMELYYITLKNEGEGSAEKYFEIFALTKVPVSELTIKNAMKKRLELKKQKLDISYVDAIGFQYAIDNKTVFVTGDSGFKDLTSENLLYLEK
ncbi:PIN domain-containing protein [Candidatus Micrarchaeota archaeon]|nr:PIN domain-containing protein [Candidatus Micrarchaeota archaeon]